jgi:hypothetical protein
VAAQVGPRVEPVEQPRGEAPDRSVVGERSCEAEGLVQAEEVARARERAPLEGGERLRLARGGVRAELGAQRLEEAQKARRRQVARAGNAARRSRSATPRR